MTTYANVGHILLKRGNTSQSTAYTGPLGEITMDTGLFAIRVHNGVTPGGNIILENGSQFVANLATAATNITTLFANAAVQANLINTINANIGGFYTWANLTLSTVANAATQANSITTLQTQVYANANVATYLPTYSGNITAANISLTANTGFPANTATVRAWARISIGTTAYWTPLYQ